MSTEKSVVRKLVRAAKAQGYTLSVWDGGEWAVKRSVKEREVLDAVFSVDEASIRLRDKDGNKAGSFFIVLGNEPDGSTVICDFTDNDVCRALANKAYGEELF